MTDVRALTEIEQLRQDLLDRMDALPFFDWPPTLLRTLIAVFELNEITLAPENTFRPYVVR